MQTLTEFGESLKIVSAPKCLPTVSYNRQLRLKVKQTFGRDRR